MFYFFTVQIWVLQSITIPVFLCFTGHQILNIIFENNQGYCSQSKPSDFALIHFAPKVQYDAYNQAIDLYCSPPLPKHMVALGFHFPGRLFGFINEAVVNVKRGEHRCLRSLNKDIPANAIGPLVSIDSDGQMALVGMYTHRYASTSYFKSLDHNSCNWIRKEISRPHLRK